MPFSSSMSARDHVSTSPPTHTVPNVEFTPRSGALRSEQNMHAALLQSDSRILSVCKLSYEAKVDLAEVSTSSWDGRFHLRRVLRPGTPYGSALAGPVAVSRSTSSL